MKFTKNFPVYVLSGALIFVGIASASQAQAAWTASEKAKIVSLTNRVNQLESALGQLTSTTDALDATLSGYKDTYIKFVAVPGFDRYCPTGATVPNLLEPAFTVSGKKFTECLMTVMTKSQ